MHLNLQIYVDTLVKKAYDNWNQVIEYDGKSLLGFKQNKRSNTSRNEVQMPPDGYSNASDHHLQLANLPVPHEQPSLNSGLPITGMYCCLH